jgi:probable rRNA maturation factor
MIRRKSLLQLAVTATVGKTYVPYLRRRLRQAHAILRSPLQELSLALVGDRQMADLHQQFLSLPGPTDVLTFPLDTARNGCAIAGEVVICVPEARRQSKIHNVPIRDELLLYALHGLLHLSGFDDRTDRDYQKMHAAEDAILQKLGVGPIFNRVRTPFSGRTGPQRAESSCAAFLPPGGRA